MKLYHPGAHVVDERGDLTGFLLHIPEQSRLIGFTTKPAQYYSLSEFNRLVEQEQVQLFQWAERRAVHKFTEEESKVFVASPRLSDEEYFENDARFNLTHLSESDVLSASLLFGGSVLRQEFVVMCLYKVAPFTAVELESMKRQFLASSIIASNLITVQGPLRAFIDWFSTTDYAFSFNPHPGTNLRNIYYQAKRIGFKPAHKEAVEYIIGQLRFLSGNSMEHRQTSEPAVSAESASTVSRLQL